MHIPKKVDVCGIEYRISFIGKKQMKRESGYAEADGCVDKDKGVVYLAKSLKKHPTRLRDTLIHEIGHALFDGCGVGLWLREKMKMNRNQWFEAEETFIRWYTPALITTLRSLGLFK